MSTVHKPLVAALALAIALASFLVIARPVAAAQNRPSWTQGDFWVYSRTEGSVTSTVRLDVHERSTLTIGSQSYSVWNVSTTITPASGSPTVSNTWIVAETMAVAQGNFTVPGFGEVLVTFDPPLVLAQFPLAANNQWSLSTTIRVVGTGFSIAFNYAASVTAEQSTTVTGGTFSVAVVRSPPTGNQRTETHYSEGAGNSVKEESYDSNGNKMAEQQLTSHQYQAGTFGLLLILIVVAIIAATAIAAIIVLRRRRARMPPPGMAPPMPPSEPPMGP